MKRADPTSGPAAGELDPISVEVIRGFLETVADEMSLTMKRTAVTPIFSESSDYSCAVMDGSARLIAQALRTASLPVHMGAMKFSVQAVLQDFESAILAIFFGKMRTPNSTILENVMVQSVGQAAGGDAGV